MALNPYGAQQQAWTTPAPGTQPPKQKGTTVVGGTAGAGATAAGTGLDPYGNNAQQQQFIKNPMAFYNADAVNAATFGVTRQPGSGLPSPAQAAAANGAANQAASAAQANYSGLPSTAQANAANGAANQGAAAAHNAYQGNPYAPPGGAPPQPQPQAQPPAPPLGTPPPPPPPPPAAGSWGDFSGMQPALETAWNQYGDQFANVGGNSAGLYGQVQGMLSGPSASQSFYGNASGALAGPGAQESLYQQMGGQFGGPTALSALAASNPYGSPMASEGLGAMAGQMLGPANTQGLQGWAQGQAMQTPEAVQMGNRLDQGYMGANQVQQFQGQNAGTLNGPGQLEQFAASALTGDNPYANMVRQEGMDAINQQLAARGAYGAGGGLAALAKYNSGLDANLFQQMGALQGQAQNATMNRMGLGADVAGRASSERMGQYGALQGLASDQFNQRMGAVNTGIGAASAADSANVARLAGQVNASTAGDQVALARLAGQTGLARDATSSNLDYLNSQFAQANAAQGNELARLGLAGSLAGQADSTQLGRVNALSGLAGQTDQFGLAGLMGMMGTAGNVQSAQGDRVNNALSNMLPGLGTNLYGQFYGQGGALSSAMDMTGINAGVNAGQLEGQGANAGSQMLWNLINMGGQNAAAAAGGGKRA